LAFSIDAEKRYWQMRYKAILGVKDQIEKRVNLYSITEVEHDKGVADGELRVCNEIIKRFEEYEAGRQPHIPGA
jgi:hypothetical protein